MGIIRWLTRRGADRTPPQRAESGTAADAVVLHAPNTFVGVQMEYDYLAEKFGQQFEDWQLDRQALQIHGDRQYDEMSITLRDGRKACVLFDITDFYGKL